MVDFNFLVKLWIGCCGCIALKAGHACSPCLKPEVTKFADFVALLGKSNMRTLNKSVLSGVWVGKKLGTYVSLALFCKLDTLGLDPHIGVTVSSSMALSVDCSLS